MQSSNWTWERKLNSSIKNSNEECDFENLTRATKFEKSNRSRRRERRIWNSTRKDEFEIQGTWIEKSNLKSKFEKSNSATKFEKSKGTAKFEKSNRNRDSRNRIEQRNENFDDKFDTKIQGTWIRNSNRKLKFEKSNRATKRKSRIRNSTSKHDFENSRNRIRESNSKYEFEIRHENFRISHETQRKRKSFTTNDRRTTRSSLTRNAHTLARNDTRTHTRNTHFKCAVVLIK